MSLFTGINATSVFANTPRNKVSLVLLADRISIALTGQPASAEDRQLILNGQITLTDYFNKFKSDPRFEIRFANFWNEILGINSPINFDSFTKPDGSTVYTNMVQALGTTTIPANVQRELFERHMSVPPNYVPETYNTWVTRLTFDSNFNTPLDDLISVDYDTPGKNENWWNGLQDCGCSLS